MCSTQEVHQRRRRLNAKLLEQQTPTPLVLEERLTAITSGEMGLDQGIVGAFPQWLSPHGGQTGLHRLPVPSAVVSLSHIASSAWSLKW